MSPPSVSGPHGKCSFPLSSQSVLPELAVGRASGGLGEESFEAAHGRL